MKSIWSLLSAVAFSLGCVGLAQGAEPAPVNPAALEAALFALPGDSAPTAVSSQPPVSPIPNVVYCQQPLTYVRSCMEIWGRYGPGPCGVNSWHWASCTQYKDPSGLWFYANCSGEQVTCSEPTGSECITSCPS